MYMSGKSATKNGLNRTHFISNVYIVHCLQTLMYTCISFNTRHKGRKRWIKSMWRVKVTI